MGTCAAVHAAARLVLLAHQPGYGDLGAQRLPSSTWRAQVCIAAALHWRLAACKASLRFRSYH